MEPDKGLLSLFGWILDILGWFKRLNLHDLLVFCAVRGWILAHRKVFFFILAHIALKVPHDETFVCLSILPVKVASLVLAKLSLLFEALAALSAGEWFYAWVNSQMILQIAALIKFALTYPTNEKGIQTVGIVVYYLSFNADDSIDYDSWSCSASLMKKLHNFELILDLLFVCSHKAKVLDIHWALLLQAYVSLTSETKLGRSTGLILIVLGDLIRNCVDSPLKLWFLLV